MRYASCVLLVLLARPALSEDSAFTRFRSVSLGTGWFDFNRQRDEATEIRVEYRSTFDRLRAFVNATTTSDSSAFFAAGVGYSLRLGRRVVVTPSFAPGIYMRGSGKELGSTLEFRSQLELAYELPKGARAFVAISHMSNAGLGTSNPGEETMSVGLEVPVWRLPSRGPR